MRWRDDALVREVVAGLAAVLVIVAFVALLMLCGCSHCPERPVVTLPCPPAVEVTSLPPLIELPPEPPLTSLDDSISGGEWVRAVTADLAEWVKAYRELAAEVEAWGASKPD